MRVGIERIDFYAGRFYTDAAAMAVARGRDPQRVAEQIMVEERTVVPLWEDAVTLAVNAAKRVLTPADLRDIDLLIAATESAVDFAKPLSTWVHRYCGLLPNCRNFEVKHACYSATAALKMAAAWVATTEPVRPGRKALVVSADFTRPTLHTGYDFAGGGCAVAMVVSANPRCVELLPGQEGYWTNEVNDISRPTSRLEIGDNDISLCSYLDALDGACGHFEQVTGTTDYARFDRHVYHAPFPGMTWQAHRTLLGRTGAPTKREVAASMQEKVLGGLRFARRVGAAYGASTFVSMLGWLAGDRELPGGALISVFAYGSGCQAEFYAARIGEGAAAEVRARDLDAHVGARRALSLPQYEANERAREAATDCANVQTVARDWRDRYDDAYDGQGLLVLDRIDNHVRHYRWS
jgi:hydroxymethylglutaryl-CoA synthase